LSISRRFVAKVALGCSEGKGKAESSRRARESCGLKQQKEYERSQYVIEYTGTHLQNELKRTQIEPQLSAEMRALRAEFEFSSTSQVLAEASNGKADRGRNRPVGDIQRTAREYENRGNELKKYFKMNDITFCMLQISRVLRANEQQYHFKGSKWRHVLRERSQDLQLPA
jgi:hypothetical protein